MSEIEIHVIGALQDPALPDLDENGAVVGVLTPAVPHDGWHVNILTEGLAARPDLEPWVVVPGHLRRVFLGRDADTVALVFPDEATGRAVLGIEAPAEA